MTQDCSLDFYQHIKTLKQFQQSSNALLLIIGEKHAGKSTLLNAWLPTLNKTIHVVNLSGQQLVEPTLLTAALTQHWATQLTDESAPLDNQLQHIMLGLARHNESCLLIIDDAETLTLPVLTTLMHLVDLQKNIQTHLHIILSGKKSLAEKINHLCDEKIPQINLRPTVEFHFTKTSDLKHIPHAQVDQQRMDATCKENYWQQHGVKSLALVGLLLVGFFMHWYGHHQHDLTHQPMHFSAVKNKVLENAERLTPAHTVSSEAPHQVAVNTTYTLQLLGTDNLTALQQYIQKHQLKQEVNVLRTQYHGKKWYVLTYGHYLSKTQAHIAAKNLPANLKMTRPWVRPIKNLGHADRLKTVAMTKQQTNRRNGKDKLNPIHDSNRDKVTNHAHQNKHQ